MTRTFIETLHHEARGGCGHPNTIRQALDWLEARYTSETRRAIRWQMNATSGHISEALALRLAYRSILKLA